jgi:hypothetical protein
MCCISAEVMLTERQSNLVKEAGRHRDLVIKVKNVVIWSAVVLEVRRWWRQVECRNVTEVGRQSGGSEAVTKVVM